MRQLIVEKSKAAYANVVFRLPTKGKKGRTYNPISANPYSPCVCRECRRAFLIGEEAILVGEVTNSSGYSIASVLVHRSCIVSWLDKHPPVGDPSKKTTEIDKIENDFDRLRAELQKSMFPTLGKTG